MVECSGGENCPNGWWFHLHCVGVKEDAVKCWGMVVLRPMPQILNLLLLPGNQGLTAEKSMQQQCLHWISALPRRAHIRIQPYSAKLVSNLIPFHLKFYQYNMHTINFNSNVGPTYIININKGIYMF